MVAIVLHMRCLPVWLPGKPRPEDVTIRRQVVDRLDVAEPLSLCKDGKRMSLVTADDR